MFFMLVQYSDIKFHENPSGGRRVVPSGRTVGQMESRTDRQTDMTKLIVPFRSLANANENDLTIFLTNIVQ